MLRPLKKSAIVITKKTKKIAAISRKRRSPYDLINDLKNKREAMVQVFSQRLSKVNQKIAELESKHETKLKIIQILENKTFEEILREESETKETLSLLRKARRLSVASK